MQLSRILLVAAALILAGGVVCQLLGHHAAVVHAPSNLNMLPTSGAGWSSTPLSAGRTEAENASVAEVLRYDDIFYREYNSGRAEFALFVVFWTPGKMPTQLVASHTPDRCWTSAGWACSNRQHASILNVNGTSLRPGEERTFVNGNGAAKHVVYWHLVGDRLYDYGDRFNAIPSIWRWWRDAVQQVFRPPPQQYFIRLSSDRPLRDLSEDSAFSQVLEILAKLGLAQSK